jgi:FlaA1/EpsC-like NDP-sugar epimerase
MVSAALQGLGLYFMGLPVPRSYYFFYALINISFTLVSRFFYRFVRGMKHKMQNRKNGTSVMIIGAGEAANIIIKEIVGSSYSRMVIKCIISHATCYFVHSFCGQYRIVRELITTVYFG